MDIIGVLYVVYDRIAASDSDTRILLATEDEGEALRRAQAYQAFAYRYEVTENEALINEQLLYEGTVDK